jgi:hypothetical protein
MLRVDVDLVGTAPFSFSAPIQSEKNTGETPDTYETRVWRERAHTDANGMAYIPPMALKNCLSEVAKFLSESVPGKGKSTYTKHFEAGLLVVDPMPLGVKAESIPGERLFVPADGRRGSGKRVWKTFPTLASWKTHATIYVLDPVLIDKPDKIQEYLKHAGKFIGMGRFRPRNNGFYGRFEIGRFRTSEGK